MNVKASFARLLRKLLLRFENEPQPPPASPPVSAWPQPKPLSKPFPSQWVAQKMSEPPTPAQKNSAPPVATNNDEVELPLQPVLEKLPPDLRERLTMPLSDCGQATISIPANQILPQLAAGVIRIAFGQLRGAAGSLFNVGEEFDSTPVTLPLDLVLPRLNRQLLSRNAAQKKVDVPQDVGNIFVQRAATTFVQKPAPVATPAPPLASSETQIRLKMAAAPAPTSAPASPTIHPIAPLPAPEISAPISTISSHAGISAAPTIPNKTAAPTAISTPLIPLAEKWPDALRLEIAQFGLGAAQIALPLDAIEAGLKRARVTFPWRELRMWIRPAPLNAVSIHDGAELELPLKILAPLFLAQKPAAVRPQKNIAVDSSIPNVFSNVTAVRTETVAPFARPAEIAFTSAPAIQSAAEIKLSETPRIEPVEIKSSPPIAESPRARALTPAEILRRAMALNGVAGAMVVLHDGLMVASELPANLNSDTVAAFVPQIFERLAQSIGELKTGALSNLRFTVGNVSWQIFRLNSVYFAVVGRENESLPEAQLFSLASELNRNRQ